MVAAEIVEDLRVVLEQFTGIAEDLGKTRKESDLASVVGKSGGS